MFLKSHHWVNEPYFKTERKKVLDVVRTPTLSVMLFDQKYYNNDTQRFNFDKLKTLSSFSLADITDDTEYGYGRRRKNWWWDSEKAEVEFKDQDRIIKIPKFTPRDDDFDQEEKIKEQQERIKAQEKRKILQLEFEEKLRKENELRVVNGDHDLTINQYKNAEILSLEEFNKNKHMNVKLKPNEEIIIINGMPILDENGNIKIFER